MGKEITLRQTGGSIAATLPKDMTDRLHVSAGGEVFAVETEQGILLTPFDPTFEKAVAAYERTASEYRDILRELAKQRPWTSPSGSAGPCWNSCTEPRSVLTEDGTESAVQACSTLRWPGFVAANVCVLLHGLEIDVEEPEAVDAVLRVADGRLDRDRLAAWMRSSVRRYERSLDRPGTPYLSASSSAVAASVFSSRYLTMTGA